MKCPKCGNNLTIDDEKCPFCGTDNPYAKKHREDMKHYEKEFTETQEDVLTASRHINAFMVKIAVISILTAVSICLFYFAANPYGILRKVNSMKISRNFSYYREQTERMEAERDYLGLSDFYNRYELYNCDRLDEYSAVFRISGSYRDIYRKVSRLAYYNKLDKDDIYWNVSKELHYLADDLDSMYRCAEPSDYYLTESGSYDEPHRSFIDDCVQDVEDALTVYFHLTEEETDSLKTLSQGRREVLLEEGLGRNE